MKIILFCYFFVPEWPSYLSGLLYTSYFHPEVTFTFVTDLTFDHPSWKENFDSYRPLNLKIISAKNLSDFFEFVNYKLKPQIHFESTSTLDPNKLNDLKPLTGTIFNNALNGYSHWGWFDPDIIIGDLLAIYSPYSQDYDFISYGEVASQGPLMIVKKSRESTRFHELLPEELIQTIVLPQQSSFGEVGFSKYLTGQVPGARGGDPQQTFKSKILTNHNCEQEAVWLSYHGQIMGQNGPCALVHFGGEVSKINSLFVSSVEGLSSRVPTSSSSLRLSRSPPPYDFHSLPDITYGVGYTFYRDKKGHCRPGCSVYFHFAIHKNASDLLHITHSVEGGGGGEEETSLAHHHVLKVTSSQINTVWMILRLSHPYFAHLERPFNSQGVA
jgi:hypothetical protein